MLIRTFFPIVALFLSGCFVNQTGVTGINSKPDLKPDSILLANKSNAEHCSSVESDIFKITGTNQDVSISVQDNSSITGSIKQLTRPDMNLLASEYMASYAHDMKFSADGSKLFYADASRRDVMQFNLAVPYDLNTGCFYHRSSTSTQDNSPDGMALSSDGTRMFMVSSANVYQYDLSTAFDLKTAVFSGKTGTIQVALGSRSGITISPDDSKLISKTNGVMYEHSIGDINDISTLAYTGKSYDLGIGTSDMGFFISEDGTKGVVGVNTGSENVYLFTMSTAWDISTISVNMGNVISAEAFDGSVSTIALSPDGRKLFLGGGDYDGFMEILLPEAYKLPGGGINSNQTTFRAYTERGDGLFISTDGTKAYSYDGTDISQFELATAWDFTSITTSPAKTYTPAHGPNKVIFNSAGTVMFVRNGTTIYEYGLSTAWDITTASYQTRSFDLSGQTATPYEMSFGNSDQSLYVTATAGIVYQYSINSSQSATSIAFVRSTDISAQSTTHYGLFFKPDGTKFYTADYNYSYVHEYSLSTAWDLSSISFVASSKSFYNLDDDLYDITFTPDGNYFFISGDNEDRIFKITAPTAWSVVGAGPSSNHAYLEREVDDLTGVTFSADGMKIYLTDSGLDQIVEFQLAQSFKPDTYILSSKKTFSVAAQDTDAEEMFIFPDGTGYFLMGNSTDTIYQYTMSTPYDITTSAYATKSWVLPASTRMYMIYVTPDGTKLFIVDTNRDLQRYSMASAWDLGSAPTIDGAAYDFLAQDGQTDWFTFNDAGTKLFVIGGSADQLLEYSLTTAFDLSTLSHVTGTGYRIHYEMDGFESIYLKPDGKTLFMAQADSGSEGIHEFPLTHSFTPSYRVCSDSLCNTVKTDWSSSLGTVSVGDYLQLRSGTANNQLETTKTQVTIGELNFEWEIQTKN